jgi:hypothetical protein
LVNNATLVSRNESLDPRSSAEGIKKWKSYPEGLGSYVNLDDMLLVFYHIEYLISLVTGIFDSLALETSSRHNLRFDPIKISLSNSSGNDFLKEVDKANSDLASYRLKQRVHQFNIFAKGKGRPWRRSAENN